MRRLLAVLCLLLAVGTARAEAVVYVVSNGWHTGIALPAAEIPDDALPVKADFPQAVWLEIGWGDGEFYQSRDPGIGTALRAVFLDNPAVLHVFAMGRPPSDVFRLATVRQVTLSDEGFSAMLAQIDRSFVRSSPGRLAPLGPGLYRNSRFYQANGQFSLGNTCNTWVAKMLAAGGVVEHPAAIVTADDLLAALPGD